LTTSPGFGRSASAFYVFPALPGIGSVGSDPMSFRELDLLDKAVLMGYMLQDTGQTISSYPEIGIGFYANTLLSGCLIWKTL